MILPLLLAGAVINPAATIPRRPGQCSWVHGHFHVTNGSSINRLGVVGTGHVLALKDFDENVPPAIRRFWSLDRPFDHELWGDFYVCARERWIKGHMQHVRIVKTRRTTTLLR